MVDRIAYGQPQVGGQGFRRTMKCFGVTAVAILAADVAVGKTTALFRVPAGFTALGIYAAASDMDTNGSPTLALSLGDSGSGVRLLSSSTIGQAGTTTSTLASTGAGYKFTVDTEIVMTATTGAATAAAGTLTALLWGFMDA